jgi:hypothetical protein
MTSSFFVNSKVTGITLIIVLIMIVLFGAYCIVQFWGGGWPCLEQQNGYQESD